jgi:D-alanyl-D-alanine carboxypeptidase (penicillin-binding protein 5/6)
MGVALCSAQSSTLSAMSSDLDRRITAPSAILVEASTGRVLWEKNPDVERPIASVVKVMTLILVMEALREGRIGLDDMCITSEHTASMGGSQIWLEPGEAMAVSELVKAVAIESANDAAVALAEHVAGSEPAFVALMNERARTLGCNNTHFINATGLPGSSPTDDCVSSARDVAIMSRQLLKYPEVHQWLTIWIGYVRDGKNMLTNTNRLIRFYPGADGLKTGYTTRSKYCLSATAVRNNVRVIGVVLGVPTSATRFSEASTLLDYGFKMCEAHLVAQAGQELGSLRVIRGVGNEVSITVDSDFAVVTLRGEGDAIDAVLELPQYVQAPIERGQRIGRIVAFVDGKEVNSAYLVAASDVPRARAFSLMVRSTKEFVRSIFDFR